ncbi:MAG: hypothetical protein HYW03_18415 [Deltaproteobacteria bacterium]|nr:hypothetical protein [Deltaproteobacteria bacterium]
MKVIYTLLIECVGGAHLKERFHRAVEVPSDMTLGDLHYFMRELTGFDDDHLSTFYMANRFGGKKTWFTATGDWDDDDEAMWNIPLAQVFPLEKKKILWL